MNGGQSLKGKRVPHVCLFCFVLVSLSPNTCFKNMTIHLSGSWIFQKMEEGLKGKPKLITCIHGQVTPWA